MQNLSELTQRDWDYVIVGTGMGGATLGHALARAGRQVLFIEKGTSARKQPLTTGRQPEDDLERPGPLTDDHKNALRLGGRYYQRYADHTNGRGRPFFPFMGAGAGGSSALYGAILERFQPGDFACGESHPRAQGSTIPKAWPVSHAEMVPYYERAEAVYSVRPSPFSAASSNLAGQLKSLGLHPYALPTSTRFLDGCRNCQGMLCARGCKIDSNVACLTPAVEQHGATLLEDCEVVGITANGHRVQELRCRVDGQDARLGGRTIVLAGGAMETPRLLLNSTSPEWPDGLGNRSGVVGRNLMRHLVDLYVLDTDLGPQTWGKEIGIPDFYQTSAGKFGGVHGMGPMPIASSVAELERNALFRAFGFITRPIVDKVIHKFASRFNLASFLEDLPFAENRVNAGPATTFRYRIQPYDRQRLGDFRGQLRAVLKPLRPKLLKQAEINERLFHNCGTCRFGDDPATSVLDRHNRVHDIENLYVVDASFFPTSGGTAPSLTIAANAIRVADHLLGIAPPAARG